MVGTGRREAWELSVGEKWATLYLYAENIKVVDPSVSPEGENISMCFPYGHAKGTGRSEQV